MIYGTDPIHPLTRFNHNDRPYLMEGLTKLELISAMALQGILANPSYNGSLLGTYADAVYAARAIIAELAKPELKDVVS